MTGGIIAGAAALLLIILVIAVYNKLAKNRIVVQEGWSGIGTYLQQRNDLIPNLVETVKGYALHESSTLAEVVKWRSRSVAATNTGEEIIANQGLNKALLEFFSVAENYPELKANANFMQLQGQLQELEENINKARRYYNGTVRDYNQSIAVFPNNVLAGMFSFKAEPFFQEDAAARVAPKVKFT